jgi:DNA invertase Pin-like site-specific DNA recombinase
MGGQIVRRYAGQEHATAGWERQQLDKLLADAAQDRKPFDAVIVADASRWSRDNVRSDTGLEALRDAGVRFFVLRTEHDLFNPEARLFLRMSASIGAYHADIQAKKSVDNRIERARRGVPTAGKVPFGRIWDAGKRQWRIDPQKQEMVRDCARRYLAGEPLPRLAREYGMNHSNLCKVLRERCGDQWEIAFRSDRLNIRETVSVPVPPLLPPETIAAVRHRLTANRTYLHKPPRSKHEFLLRGRVFCAACGYAMFGQENGNGRLYYRHCHHDRVKECPLKDPRPWVPAKSIEGAVVRDLFDMFGNPAAIERAVKASAPECDKALMRRADLEKELAKIDKARNRLLGLIERDAITDAQAEAKLVELKDRSAGLRAELDKLAQALAGMPDERALKVWVERIKTEGWNPVLDRPMSDSIVVMDDEGNQYAGGNDVASFVLMSNADRRALIENVFGDAMPDGSPAGIYLTPAGGAAHGPKSFTYQIRGRLTGSLMPYSLY